MARLAAYLKFIFLTALVSVTCIIMTAFEEIRKMQYMTTGTEHLDIRNDQPDLQNNRKWFFWNDDVTTMAPIQGRVIRTKTEYPITATLEDPYLINNKFICRNVEKVSCIVMVHTAPDHTWRRTEMRRTWLNASHYSPENVRAFFLLGTTNRPEVQKEIDKENEKYHDIIQGKFLDSYRNLTNKGVLGYRWITEYCKNAEFVAKVDDDAFINFFKLFEELKSQLFKRKKFIFCNRIPRYTMPILRKANSKWFVSPDEYRSFSKYPHQYCSGFTVFISTDLVPALYHAAKGTPFFWVDDFFLFGLLPSRSGEVTYEPLNKNLSFAHPEALKCYKDQKEKCKYLVMPARDEELDNMWKAVVDGKKRSEFGYYYMKLQNTY